MYRNKKGKRNEGEVQRRRRRRREVYNSSKSRLPNSGGTVPEKAFDFRCLIKY
jgi:hypothetical protein